MNLLADYVERLARAKAAAVQEQFPDAIVIAADTSLGVDGAHFRKTSSRKQHAFAMWKQFLDETMMCFQVFVYVQKIKFTV